MARSSSFRVHWSRHSPTAELASEFTGTLVIPTQLGSARELVYIEPEGWERMLREVRDESF
jgi:hypothetical protein